MKRTLILLAAALATLSLQARRLTVSTPHLSLVIDANEGSKPQYVYFGSRLAATDIDALPTPTGGRFDLYPAYGENTPAEAAFSCRHADGNPTTALEITGSTQTADLTTIHMKDPKYALTVDMFYRTRTGSDIIECWTEIHNQERGTVTLTQYASAVLPIRRGHVWQSSLYGTWADEAQVHEEELIAGESVIRNNDGTRNAHTSHAEVMFSLDGRPQELTGTTIGAALVYSGNYKLKTITDDTEYHYYIAGINEENSEYHLRRGESFTTPALALTLSHDGMSGVSRNFHSWGRKYMLNNGDQDRMILLNSWEGVYFDINQERMDQMMADIADMGGELFVMDDGWFGTKYKRNKDNAALGDWDVDTTKLPGGIEGLIASAKKHGIKFGIWLEPEMTNTESVLYEKHPDWVLRSMNRDLKPGRGGTQLVLDLCNPRVQDFVFDVVDRLMTRYPDIAYIKWDANMAVQDAGSSYLPAADQTHVYIAYHRGLENVLSRLRQKYPDLVIQDCASGGGRVNYGTLRWFDEYWTSDNTDALQRVYMQWGTSYFFPALAMGSHISNAPNHQTFRTIPIKYRIDVAMSGRLGMEIQPAILTAEEKAQCKKAIAEYKEIRPVVQHGDIYRLQSPFEHKGLASLMYVSTDKQKAVWYWWKTETFVSQHLPVVKLAGLDPNRHYRVRELDRIDNEPLFCEGKTYSGQLLMEQGLDLPYTNKVDYNKLNDWASRVIYLEAID